MSTKFEDWELEDIYVVIQQSDAQKLIDEKNKVLFDMDRTRTPSSKTPSPAPKPQGDIRITKTDKTETIYKEDNEKRKQQTEKYYNNQIKQEITKTAERRDYDQETIQNIEDMPEKDLSVLAEKGVDGYKEFQKQRELETDKENMQKENSYKEPKDERQKSFDDKKQDIQQEKNQEKGDLDITMGEEQSRELFGDRGPDQKEKPLEDKDKQSEKDIETDIKMDEKETERTFSSSQEFEFDQNSKDMDLDRTPDKTPDPSDDFE